MAKVIGEISENAINIATYEEREKINKLGLEKFKLEEQEKALQGQAGNEQQLAAIKQQLTSVQTEITKTQDEIDRTYGIGSEKGMAIRAVTAALQAAAQNDTAGSLVALASPYLNQKIHEMTAGDTAKDKATNLMAHALLSAVEFQVTGKDPLTGAIAGVTGEATAEIIARAYGKPVSELTANEKENISTLSQLAGGLAAALTAKANGTLTEQGGSFLAATSGAETAKRAVENNYLSVADVENLIRELSKAQKEGRDTKPILEKYEGISEENRQQLIACKGNVACETAHLHEMNTGGEELERNLGFFSRMTVYYPNDLNTANRIALSNLVERENAESFSKLSDTTKFGLNAMEAGTAIGLGAAAGSAKAGLSNVKSLINGKNKAYPTSGMDGYKRTNVGDEDYRSSGAGNAYVDPRTEKLKSVLPTGRQMLDPSEVSFSQATVSYQKKGKGYNYDTMVEDMRKNGWNGKPVDVVNMLDNAPTSMDNTRILAARNAGIKVDAIVHNYSDKLSYEDIRRFGVGNTYPKTWGEAIELRVKKQSSMSGVDKNWSTKFSHGSLYDPKVVK